jgi:hypothetical protein
MPAGHKARLAPPVQILLAFCVSDTLPEKTQAMGGDDVSGLGKVHFVGRDVLTHPRWLRESEKGKPQRR